MASDALDRAVQAHLVDAHSSVDGGSVPAITALVEVGISRSSRVAMSEKVSSWETVSNGQ